ncbi:hypothetical protein I6E42_10525 [Pseudoflavonifractor phocaeensis]|nr:hypothetical protein [Pseudoflavonifractor phocaeensis]
MERVSASSTTSTSIIISVLFRGVYYNKKRNKWIAQIMFKRKCYYLGGFEKIEDAVKARARGEEMFDNFLDWYYGQRKTFGGDILAINHKSTHAIHGNLPL